MTPEQITRLRTVFKDLQRVIQDTTVKHNVTMEEMLALSQWVRDLVAAEEVDLAVLMLLGIPAMTSSTGQAYADPGRDGATPWMVEGPAHVAGAPDISNPGLLPMRPDEAGEALFVDGVVKSTSGYPVAGAVIDVWQNDNHGLYSSMTLEAAGPVPGIVDFNAPPYNLRGKITTDADGRYAFRSVTPGPELVSPIGSFFEKFVELLDIANSRPLHVHSIVTAEGFHPLTHQIYFYGDPLTLHSTEGPLEPTSMYRSVVRHGPVPFGPQPANDKYYAVTCDYVLRPVEAG